jgi:hypothetical protein
MGIQSIPSKYHKKIKIKMSWGISKIGSILAYLFIYLVYFGLPLGWIEKKN